MEDVKIVHDQKIAVGGVVRLNRGAVKEGVYPHAAVARNILQIFLRLQQTQLVDSV